MSGIAWESKEDIAEIGSRIATHDEPHKKRFLEIRERLKDRLKGRSYSGGTELDEDVGSNDVLEFAANLEPALASQLPDVEVYSDKGGAAYGAARGLHHALNQWMVETNYLDEILKSANEYALGYAVRVRGVGPRKGYEDEGIDFPWSESVPLDQVGWDMRASSFDKSEYVYQIKREFKKDILDRARRENEGLNEGDPGYWDLEAIDRMGEDCRGDGKTSFYVVYLPRADASKLLPDNEKYPERYKGVQLFLSAGSNEQNEFTPIRNAAPHYGSNPYTVIGMQRIPDESMAVSVLALTIDQAENYNAVVAANTRASKDYRNILIVAQKKLGQLIQSSRDRHVYWDASFQKDQVTNLPIGGVTDQEAFQEQRLEMLYHRAVGQSEADRGALTPGAKATDIALASAASGARRAGQVNTFHLGIKRELEGIVELLFYTDTIVVDLGPEAAQEGGSSAPVFFGGEFDKKQIQAYYKKHYPDVELREEDLKEGPEVLLADLKLRLKVGSMGRQSKQEQMQEAFQEMGIAEQVTQFLIMNPPVDARKYVRYVAKRTSFPELADFIDFAWVEFMRALMLQGAAQGMSPAQGEEPAGTLKTGRETMVLGGGGGGGQLQPQNVAGPESGMTAGQTRDAAFSAGVGM